MKPLLENIRTGRWALMGILNVTPDSFSDGGQFVDQHEALRHALQMQDDGAAIIDIGGESTRPGAIPVSIDEELDRVVPVIERIHGESDVLISVDTSKPEVMRAAIAAGAAMVNDVNALHSDGALEVCAENQVAVCLMHKQGTPQTMQDNPTYHDVTADVKEYLLQRATACIEAGIRVEDIVIDPGFGFGKTLQNNLSLLEGIDVFTALDFPVLVGISRKSMFGALLDRDVEHRLVASTSAAVIAYNKGARLFRVHDVAETCDALRLSESVNF